MNSSESTEPPADGGTPEHRTNFVIEALGGDLARKTISLADLVENTLDAVLFLDQQGVVRYWNRGAEELFQFGRDDVVGEHVRFLVPADLVESRELERLRDACDHDGVVFNHLTRRLRKDGTEVWVSLTRTVLHDEHGEPVGAIATLRDISDQRSREAELRRARELALVGELAAKVAHEVKNPLAGIFAALQVLEGGLEQKDPRREIFASIGDEVMRLNELTQNLLGFSRPTNPQLKSGDLGVYLEALVGDLQRISMVGPQTVVMELSGDLTAKFDPALTSEVFRNLILNAEQVIGEDGRIVLRSTRSESWLAIEVADDGPGVPLEQRARIFEPFFTTKARGTGLGLAIARKNVEAQGGRIRLCDESEGGAVFRVEFPV